MKYCTKCGAKLNDDDLFCGNCGAKVNSSETPKASFEETKEEDYFSNNYAENRVTYKTHPCSKAGLILSIIGLVLFVISVLLVIPYLDEPEMPYAYAALVGLGLIFTFALAFAALGTSIPGFILGKKKGLKSGVALAALILSGILGGILLIIYVIGSLR